MKIYLLVFLICCNIYIVLAQQPMKINTLQDGQNQYTFSGIKDNKTIKVTIAKTNQTSQLTPANSETLWIGKNNAFVRYFNITITFSEPVTSASFLLSHFNNDETGDEQISKFRVLDSQALNITSSSTFNWIKGEASGDPSSLESATEFDPKNKIIKASYGYGAEVATGRLVISNNKSFTQISFQYQVIEGTPNGFYINGDIDITRPIPPPPAVVKEEKTYNDITKINSSVKHVTKDSALNVIPQKEQKVVEVDSVKKKSLPVPIEKKATPAVVKKTVPKSSPVKAKPIKQQTVATTGSKKTVITTSTFKKTTNLKPAIKTAVKPKATTQTITPKAPVKKTSVTPVKVKAETLSEKTREIKEIKSMQVGEKVKLNKVFFKQSVAVLLPESYPQLDTLVLILKQLPTLEIELQGHTDNQGDPKLNMQLSQQRVTVVKQYLVSKGIQVERLTEKGFGGSRAAVTNDTEVNRRKNRRVEFMITKR